MLSTPVVALAPLLDDVSVATDVADPPLVLAGVAAGSAGPSEGVEESVCSVNENEPVVR